jgi:predicted RNA-binding protein with PIN domain
MERRDIDPRHLRSAVEFAVLMAHEGRKFKPPLPFPPSLKRYLTLNRIPNSSLAAAARAIENDDDFRRRIAIGALPELVDEIGRLWLARPDGWRSNVDELVAATEVEAAEADSRQALKRAEKRRTAAEQAAARTRAEFVVLQTSIAERDRVIEGLRSDVVKLTDELDELRSELIDMRLEVRHSRDRELAAVTKLEVAEAARDQALTAQGSAESVRDDVLADRATLAAERSELARLAASAESIAAQLTALAAPPAVGKPRAVGRRALSMPGGVMGDSEAAAEYLLRSGASVLVDGYNVSKLAWPKLDLEGQRVVLLDAVENLTRRYGSDMTVVFDGADVVGANTDRRRVIRVLYSAAGVIADDVLRDEVRRLPPTRQVVVVTNDREIIADVRALGANTMSSQQLIALMK